MNWKYDRDNFNPRFYTVGENKFIYNWYTYLNILYCIHSLVTTRHFDWEWHCNCNNQYLKKTSLRLLAVWWTSNISFKLMKKTVFPIKSKSTIWVTIQLNISHKPLKSQVFKYVKYAYLTSLIKIGGRYYINIFHFMTLDKRVTQVIFFTHILVLVGFSGRYSKTFVDAKNNCNNWL